MNTFIMRLVDIAVFSILAYLAATSYVAAPNLFDLINLLALVYVACRKPDINTVSLVCLIVTGRVIDSVLFYDLINLSNYWLHSCLFLLNTVAITVIWFRPLLVARWAPQWVGDHRQLALTHQDMLLGGIFTLQAVFQLLALLEHISRHLADFGLLAETDGIWWYENSRFIFDCYQTVQFGFALLTVSVLYFMTFDAVKQPRL